MWTKQLRFGYHDFLRLVASTIPFSSRQAKQHHLSRHSASRSCTVVTWPRSVPFTVPLLETDSTPGGHSSSSYQNNDCPEAHRRTRLPVHIFMSQYRATHSYTIFFPTSLPRLVHRSYRLSLYPFSSGSTHKSSRLYQLQHYSFLYLLLAVRLLSLRFIQ